MKNNERALAMRTVSKSIASFCVVMLIAPTLTAAQETTTVVTDAVGTKETWTFKNVVGFERLQSRVNQIDGKGIYYTYRYYGKVDTRTDEEGRVTKYRYYRNQQVRDMTEAAGTPQERVTSYQYINYNQNLSPLKETRTSSISTGKFKKVTNTYDDNLNVIAVTIAGFDSQGNAVSRATTFEHDAYGKVTQIDGPRIDVNDITNLEYYNCNTGAECGQLKQVTNALGQVTTYDSYDAASRLLQMTNPNGVVTNNTYHPRGWLLSTTQTPPTGSARITYYNYDNVGQLIETTLPDGTIQTYVYDAAHDLREISDNLGNKVTYTYDAKGNRTHELVHDPDGTLVRSTITSYDIRNFISSINSGGSVTQLINDAVGNLTQQTDPNANPDTQHDFDAFDRLTNTVDALTNNSGYQYNVADQLTQVTAPNGSVTQYEYDDLGNQTKEISADRGAITYAHDAAGNATSMTDARGITTTYQYDALNRLTSVIYPTASENIIFTYDTGCLNPIGRLCQVQDNSGITQYDYDAWGNVTRVEKQAVDHTGTNIGTYVTTYQYDSANRVTQTTYPSGRVVNTTRDAIGRLNGLTTTANSSTTQLITNRSYRADGVWTQQSYGNGLVQSKTYDLQGRLTNHIAGSYQRNYQFDANGNILSADAPDNSVDRDYAYDVLDRLTQDSDPIKAMLRNFNYDANGNRTQFQENTTTSQLNYSPSSNRLSDIDGMNLVLDASGRTLSDHAGRAYTYNDAGRIETITQGGAVVGEYTYDHQQLRTHKVIAGNISTVYHYDLAGNLIAESDDTGAVIQEYLYADGERVATFDVQLGVQYYVNDHLYTPQRLVDSGGQVTWEAAYNAFGKVEIVTELVVNNHRFPGQYFDAETGLHYNWNRYYDPATGRYVTSDPIGLDGGNNTYGYVGGMPTKYFDSTGLFKVDKSCKGDCLREDIEREAKKACNNLVAGITNPKIKKCVEKRCKKAKIKCNGKDCFGPGRESRLGFAYLKGRSAYLCIDRIKNPSTYGPVIIHEWGHTCGWGGPGDGHPPGSGLPGSDGILPNPE